MKIGKFEFEALPSGLWECIGCGTTFEDENECRRHVEESEAEIESCFVCKVQDKIPELETNELEEIRDLAISEINSREPQTPIDGLEDEDWKNLMQILGKAKHSDIIEISRRVERELNLSETAIQEGHEKEE